MIIHITALLTITFLCAFLTLMNVTMFVKYGHLINALAASGCVTSGLIAVLGAARLLAF